MGLECVHLLDTETHSPPLPVTAAIVADFEPGLALLRVIHWRQLRSLAQISLHHFFLRLVDAVLHVRAVSDHFQCWPRSATEATLHEFSDQMLNSLLANGGNWE